jgi:hypothetical protein
VAFVVQELDLDVDVTFLLDLVFNVVESSVVISDGARDLSDLIFVIWISVVGCILWNELVDGDFKSIST